MIVPDNSFVVGVPGKIKGQVTPGQLRWVQQEGPMDYTDLGRQYKEEGL